MLARFAKIEKARATSRGRKRFLFGWSNFKILEIRKKMGKKRSPIRANLREGNISSLETKEKLKR